MINVSNLKCHACVPIQYKASVDAYCTCFYHSPLSDLLFWAKQNFVITLQTFPSFSIPEWGEQSILPESCMRHFIKWLSKAACFRVSMLLPAAQVAQPMGLPKCEEGSRNLHEERSYGLHYNPPQRRTWQMAHREILDWAAFISALEIQVVESSLQKVCAGLDSHCLSPTRT